MLISRESSNTSKWTFDVVAIQKLLCKYVPSHGLGWVDPFAGKNIITEHHNNLSTSGIDALDYMKTFLSCSLDGAIFDPPYSMEQVSRSYKSVGINDWQSRFSNLNGGFPKVKDEIARTLKPNGIAICFGWNSYGLSPSRGF